MIFKKEIAILWQVLPHTVRVQLVTAEHQSRSTSPMVYGDMTVKEVPSTRCLGGSVKAWLPNVLLKGQSIQTASQCSL